MVGLKGTVNCTETFELGSVFALRDGSPSTYLPEATALRQETGAVLENKLTVSQGFAEHLKQGCDSVGCRDDFELDSMDRREQFELSSMNCGEEFELGCIVYYNYMNCRNDFELGSMSCREDFELDSMN